MTIPKIIHYCWFGTKEKPELVKKCVESWKKYLPDYEYREWGNSDLENCEIQYVKDAIKEKKWAFVSDYFRLYALFNYGGIYLDSDNEVFKNFDNFLNLDFFTGYEKYRDEIHSFTAVVGAVKNNHIIKDLLLEYNDAKFYQENGELNLFTNTNRVENYFKIHYNLYPPFNPEEQKELEDNCILFPANYFCEYNPKISYSVHHFNGSWVPDLTLRKCIQVLKYFEIKIYTVKQGCFCKSLKKIKGIPIVTYPRYKKRTVIITIGKNNAK